MLNVLALRFRKFIKGESAIMLVMLCMGLLLTFVFGLAFSGDYKPRVMVADEDSSDLSRQLLESLETTNQYAFVQTNLKEAQGKVEDGMATAVLYIKKGFSDDVSLSAYNDNVVIMRNNETMENWSLLLTVQDTVNEILTDHSYAVTIRDLASGMGLQVDRQEVLQKIAELRENPAVTVGPELQGPVQDKSTLIHFILGFMLFFSTFTITFAAADILQDKLNGTWNRLMVSPSKRYGVLAGHLIAAFAMGVLQIGLMVVLGKSIFHVEWGSNIPGVLLVLFLFILVITSFGLFLAAALRTMEQLSGIVPVVLVSTAMLGGCMWPLDIISFKPMLYAADITPHMWAMKALTDLVQNNASLASVTVPLAVLAGMAVFWFLLGLWRLNANYK